jgi:hypothetical protein
MRRTKLLLLMGAALSLSLLPGSAHAAPGVELRDVSCKGLTVVGSGLPPDTRLTVAISEDLDSPVVRRATVRTSTTGWFQVRLDVPMKGFEEVYAGVGKAGAARYMVMGEQEFARPCSLPFTGPEDTAVLLAVALALLAGGGTLRFMSRYQAAH